MGEGKWRTKIACRVPIQGYLRPAWAAISTSRDVRSLQSRLAARCRGWLPTAHQAWLFNRHVSIPHAALVTHSVAGTSGDSASCQQGKTCQHLSGYADKR